MTSTKEWPSDGGPHTSDSIGQALAGLVARDSAGNPIPGMIAPPAITAVGGTWKVQVSRFVYVRNVAGRAVFAPLSAAEQIDIPNAASIPAGQARIDRLVFDATTGIVRVPGVVSASPVAPADGGMVRVATVRVQAGDSQVVAARVIPDFARTRLVGGARVSGVVAPRSVVASGSSSVPVVFPVGMFDAPPIVQATLSPGVRDCSVYVENITKDGCTIGLGSNSVVSRTLGALWVAEAA